MIASDAPRLEQEEEEEEDSSEDEDPPTSSVCLGDAGEVGATGFPSPGISESLSERVVWGGVLKGDTKTPESPAFFLLMPRKLRDDKLIYSIQFRLRLSGSS